MCRTLLGAPGLAPLGGFEAQQEGGAGWMPDSCFSPCFGTSQNPEATDKALGPGVCLLVLGQSPEGQLGVKVEITGE